MKIGYITDSKISDSEFDYNFRQILSDQLNHKIYRIDPEYSTKPIAYQILDLIRESDFLIFNISSGKRNIYYEIGIAVGKEKPFLLLVHEKVSLPPDLLSIFHIKYNESNLSVNENEFKQAIRYFTNENKYLSHFNKHEYDSNYIDITKSQNKTELENIYLQKGPSRYKNFEKWIFDLFDKEISFTVINEPKNKSDMPFDLLLWNEIKDPEFEILGNPIPIELKSLKTINVNTWYNLLNQAKHMGLNGIIFITLGKNDASTNKIIKRIRESSKINAISVDYDDLMQIYEKKSISVILKNKIRELMYKD